MSLHNNINRNCINCYYCYHLGRFTATKLATKLIFKNSKGTPTTMQFINSKYPKYVHYKLAFFF